MVALTISICPSIYYSNERGWGAIKRKKIKSLNDVDAEGKKKGMTPSDTETATDGLNK